MLECCEGDACLAFPEAATFHPAVSEAGQKSAAENAGSAPISENLREKVLAAIDLIKVD